MRKKFLPFYKFYVSAPRTVVLAPRTVVSGARTVVFAPEI